jgi:hypothetical protein
MFDLLLKKVSSYFPLASAYGTSMPGLVYENQSSVRKITTVGKDTPNIICRYITANVSEPHRCVPNRPITLIIGPA